MSKLLIGKHQATIYPEGDGYTGAISLGFDGRGVRQRIKRKGRTKAAVKDKLIKAVNDLETGIEASDAYTVAEAVDDWLAKGTKNLGAGTIDGYRTLANQRLIPRIGNTKLKRLSADDVDDWLDELTDTLSTRTLQGVHSILRRAIRQAQVRDKVARNVADLVTTPKGRPGRPSRSLTLDQAIAVLDKAQATPLYGYVVVSLLAGIRTEEARELRWDHVVAGTDDPAAWQPVTTAGFDHERFAIYVWRSVREDGDTKTEKSRRTLELPAMAADALRALHTRQAAQRLAAGRLWRDHGLVFCTRVGTPLSAANVRRSLRSITTAAGIGEHWTPRELRHSFVSILSDHGVPIEVIADLVGHKNTTVTSRVYRHQIRPVIAHGAQTMDAIFNQHKNAKSA
jgi:integrase